MEKSDFEKAIEKSTKKTVEYLRDTPISEIREDVEKENNRPLSFTSEFPFIGRRNVNRNKIIASEEVNELLDKSLV